MLRRIRILRLRRHVKLDLRRKRGEQHGKRYKAVENSIRCREDLISETQVTGSNNNQIFGHRFMTLFARRLFTSDLGERRVSKESLYLGLSFVLN